MQPIKIRFTATLTANDQDFNRRTGVNKINEVFEQGWKDVKDGYLAYTVNELLPHYKNEIEQLFLADFATKAFTIESCTFQLKDVKHGRTPVPYSGQSYQYDVDITLTSILYTCVQIFETGNCACYNENDRELKIFSSTAKIIVQPD